MMKGSDDDEYDDDYDDDYEDDDDDIEETEAPGSDRPSLSPVIL